MPRSLRIGVACALGAASLAAAPAAAQYVSPASYVATPGQGQAHGGSFNYFDDTGTQLTDGVIGANDWQANLGSGPAYEWVGWVTVDPTMQFLFGAPTTISSVEIGFNRGTGGVFLPGSVLIGSESFVVDPTALAFGTRGFLTFDIADVTTQALDITLTRAGGWVFVDEVRFVGSAVTAVPEPSTYALVATGIAGLGVIARRRRRA